MLRDDNSTVFVASGGLSIGSGGFGNYMGGASHERQEGALARVFAKFPDAIVVDGDDDWYAPITNRPEAFASKLGIKPLARFHTGISGISPSGIVISKEDYDKFDDALKAVGPEAGKRLSVYSREHRRRNDHYVRK